ncbi:YlbF family regulator [Staphylococcus ratti]|uniref:YlbF family regulator n=1 Tax=Staphylococcus ratti TaxID=2892440 RepID=A0ABY3PAF6_9STAP|nr:YlbF family regulator [Staphylococcus ratti]UEX89283.1 YlbF family regulator [Staphylococcus ratti]
MFTKEAILHHATQLSNDIQALEAIRNYRQIEAQIHRHPQIAQYMDDLKQNQKHSVNFQSYNKPIAYQRSEEKIASIQSEIDAFPIVTQFRQSQEEANETLHLIVETLATRLQER